MSDIIRNAGSSSVLFVGINLVGKLFKENNPLCKTPGETFAYSVLYCVFVYFLMMLAKYRQTGAYDGMFNALHFKYAFYGTLIFFLLSSKESYELVAKAFGGTVDSSNCPTFQGIGVHAIIFFCLVALVMWLPADKVAEHLTLTTPKRPTLPACEQLTPAACGKRQKDCMINGNKCQKKCESMSITECKNNSMCGLNGNICQKKCDSMSITECNRNLNRCMTTQRKCKTRCDKLTTDTLCNAQKDSCIWNPSAAKCEKQCNVIATEKECSSPRCMWSETGKTCSNPCETLGDEAACNSVSKMCTWKADKGCVKKEKCDKLNTQDKCKNVDNCEWTPCGTCQDKDILQCEDLDENECIDQVGNCQLDDNKCKKSCGKFLCEAACNKESRCTWNDSKCHDKDTLYDPNDILLPAIN